MPTATLYTQESESGQSEVYATFSYKIDDTFADARHTLVHCRYVDYEFDFLDPSLGIRMRPFSERGNLIAESHGRVVVMPKCGSSPGTAPIYISSGASNEVSVTATDAQVPSDDTPTPELALELSQPCDEPAEDVNLSSWDCLVQDTNPSGWDDPSEAADPPAEDVEVDPCFIQRSTTLEPDLKRLLGRLVENLKDGMVLLPIADQKYQVRSWDQDGSPRVAIRCLECEHTYKCAAYTGLITQSSINNLFTNFRSKHLITPTHIQCVARNRGERRKLQPSEMQKRQADNAISSRVKIDLALKVLEMLNKKHSLWKPVFEVVGDVYDEALDIKLLKVMCSFCDEHFTLVPIGGSLEQHLVTHLNSLFHHNNVAKSKRPVEKEGIRTGKPGRPRAGDKRDRTQTSIQGFLSAPRGDVGLNGKGILDRKSLLCWGLWSETERWGDETRPIKQLLFDPLKFDGVWFAEPLMKRSVWCLKSQKVCHIDGLFRHKDCSLVSQLGGGFEGLTCEHCAKIKLCDDFRARVKREHKATEKRGDRGTGRGRRLGYLTQKEIEKQARNYRFEIPRLRKQSRALHHQLTMLRMRSPKLSDLCREAADRKDLMKFCNDIVLAHRRGAFGGKAALWDMLRDIATNINRKAEGQRWRKGTKLLMQTLFLHGGRHVVDCLATNGISPSIKTLQRDRGTMAVFCAGIHEQQFKFVAMVLSVLKKRHGISGPIPVYLAKDETSVKKTVRWQPKHDSLLGFCGTIENHMCQARMEIKVGDGEVGFMNIVDSFDSCVVGHQARCIMVSPLVAGFPRLCLLATGTCNKFDANWVRRQWVTLDEMWTTHCLEAVGPVLGHASDGDSRRRKLMLEDYIGMGTPGQKVNLGWDGWLLAHSMTKDGCKRHAFGIHDQDYIHNQKKLVNPLDSCARHLKLGADVATITHLVRVFALYNRTDHLLHHEDVVRSDRQNWASAQRLCNRNACNTLRLLRERLDAKRERTLGTEMYLGICANYVDIFLNSRMTLRDRIVLCGKVGFFFRLWRLWCFHGNHAVGGNTTEITFGRNCIPMQTFLDIQMSVHMVVFLIIQFRDNFRSLPVPLDLTGSDSCEQFFSKVGGMRGHERSYDLMELVECATVVNRLVAMDLSKGLLGAGKSHKKHTNIWMKLHPIDIATEKEADLTDYTGIETNADVVSALKEGLELAKDVAVKLQMNPSTSCRNTLWWDSPWKVEAKGVDHGGWCEVNVDNLDPLDLLDPEQTPIEPTDVTVAPVETSRSRGSVNEGDDGSIDARVVEAQCRDTMASMFCVLVYEKRDGQTIEEVCPTVTFEGKTIFKSYAVSQLVENPHLSKDRLTRVKQGFYFTAQADKPRVREGEATMFITVGSDVGVVFYEDRPPPRETRGTEPAARKKKTGQKRKGKQNTSEPVSKRPRGDPASVAATDFDGPQYKWYIGRVQEIQRKYGSRTDRSREPVDLLDRPGVEAGCKLICNWFTSSGQRRNKFTYDVCDTQLIELESVISSVHLTVDPTKPDIFVLDLEDVKTLDNFVKNRLE